MTTFGDLFTARQLVALTTFSDLVQEARERVKRDALAAGLPDDGKPLRDGGTGATAYADAVAVYLAFAVDKADRLRHRTLCTWSTPKNEIVGTRFARQAIPMVWDFAEANPFADVGGHLVACDRDRSQGRSRCLTGDGRGHARLRQMRAAQTLSTVKVVSTDPPYYDNVGYADLSDFFYVWLRRSLKPVFPDLFATLACPRPRNWLPRPTATAARRRRRRSSSMA